MLLVALTILRILFVGNSLTMGPVWPGFAGGYGMAASAPDRDYAHRVQLMLAAQTGVISEITILSLDVQRDDLYRAAQAAGDDGYDLVVVQLGDNAWQLAEDDYKSRLRQILGWYPPGRTVLTGSWYFPTQERYNAEVAAETGVVFVPVYDLHIPANQQRVACGDDPVCTHPGNTGMEAIAGRIVAVAGTMQMHHVYLPWYPMQYE